MKSSICPAVFTLMFSAVIASVDLCAQSSNVDPSRDGLVKCALTVREPVFFRGTTNTNGFFVYPITFSATVRQPLPATAKTNQTAGEVVFSTKPENNRISTPNIIALATTNVPNPPRAMRLVAFLDQSGDPTLLNENLDSLRSFRQVITRFYDETDTPVFIVLDEIGNAFTDGSLTLVEKRKHFLNFREKVISPCLMTPHIYFLLMGNADFSSLMRNVTR
jgi:hypothetical protein